MTLHSTEKRSARKPYAPPRIDTYTAADVLHQLGPAIAIYGMTQIDPPSR